MSIETLEATLQEMNGEDLAEYIYSEELKAKIAGFASKEEMDNFKVDASSGMIKFGGGFAHFLGHALARADGTNTVKLLRAFRDECTHHAELYRKFLSNRLKEEKNEDAK